MWFSSVTYIHSPYISWMMKEFVRLSDLFFNFLMYNQFKPNFSWYKTKISKPVFDLESPFYQ